MEPSGDNICPSCKQPLPVDSPLGGLCPQCLVKSGFNSGSAPGSESGSVRQGFAAPLVEYLQPHFAHLDILELIGRGGMGAVYKARQPKLNRLVALKILAREGDADARFPDRFQREAQALAHMNHPNIVTVYDFGEAGGFYYLLMEYVDGLNLRQVEQSKKLTPEEALAIVPPICDALQYAHSQGVVHRDIKPENILLDKNGRVKIADFGIAKILGTEPGESLTGDEHRVGTPHYMAPEQVERPAIVDHRADIYSLGVVFYEMLTGELPLGRFAPPSKKVQIDVRLDEIVLRALEKEPELRFQQASDVKTQVERLTTSDRPAANSPNNLIPPPEEIDPKLAEADKARRLQALQMGGVTMILMLALGDRIVADPAAVIWWYFGFGIGLLSIVMRYYRLRKTPALIAMRLDKWRRPLTSDHKEGIRGIYSTAIFVFGLFLVYMIFVNGFDQFGAIFFFIFLANALLWTGGLRRTVISERMFRLVAQFAAFATALFIFIAFFWRLSSTSMTEHELFMSIMVMLVLVVLFVVAGLVVGLGSGQNGEWERPKDLTADKKQELAADAHLTSEGVLGAALTVVWIYAALTGVVLIDIGLNSVNIFLIAAGVIIPAFPFIFILATSAVRRWLGTTNDGGQALFRANGILGINISLAVLIGGGFALYAVVGELQTKSGWNPNPTELVVVVLLWLGMLLTPWAAIMLIKAGWGTREVDGTAASANR